MSVNNGVYFVHVPYKIPEDQIDGFLEKDNVVPNQVENIINSLSLNKRRPDWLKRPNKLELDCYNKTMYSIIEYNIRK